MVRFIASRPTPHPRRRRGCGLGRGSVEHGTGRFAGPTIHREDREDGTHVMQWERQLTNIRSSLFTEVLFERSNYFILLCASEYSNRRNNSDIIVPDNSWIGNFLHPGAAHNVVRAQTIPVPSEDQRYTGVQSQFSPGGSCGARRQGKIKGAGDKPDQ